MERYPDVSVLRVHSPRSYLLSSICVALIYLSAALGGLTFAAVGSTVTLIWAPSGIALAALLLLGYQTAPVVALSAFAANAWTGVPLEVAAGVAIGNTLEALAGMWLLTRRGNFRHTLERRRDVLALMALAAAASTTLSASVGVTMLSWSHLLPSEGWVSAWVKWWLGDMMGVLVVAPAILVWMRTARPALSRIKAIEALVLGISVVVASYLIFGPPELAGNGYYPAALAVFPLVIWAALSFGQLGSTLLSLTVSTLAVLGTTQGTGPFVVDDPVDSLVRWCVFAIIVASTGLLLAASVLQQRQAQAELKTSHAELEQQVSDRTRELRRSHSELLREMTERRLLESDLIRISEVQQQAIGRELHDGLGQHLTSLALMAASLQQRLGDRRSSEVDCVARIVQLANEASAMTQSLSRGLYPVAFEFGGVAAALERLAEQTRASKGINCQCTLSPEAQIDESIVALNLYRIAQEAVNNAVKYSNARSIQIELSGSSAQHRLCVSDDGVGFEIDRAHDQHGVGMHSMRYRARLLGGTLTVSPQPLGGTRIVVTTELRSNA